MNKFGVTSTFIQAIAAMNSPRQFEDQRIDDSKTEP